jgi:hypothetical protein
MCRRACIVCVQRARLRTGCSSACACHPTSSAGQHVVRFLAVYLATLFCRGACLRRLISRQARASPRSLSLAFAPCLCCRDSGTPPALLDAQACNNNEGGKKSCFTAPASNLGAGRCKLSVAVALTAALAAIAAPPLLLALALVSRLLRFLLLLLLALLLAAGRAARWASVAQGKTARSGWQGSTTPPPSPTPAGTPAQAATCLPFFSFLSLRSARSASCTRCLVASSRPPAAIAAAAAALAGGSAAVGARSFAKPNAASSAGRCCWAAGGWKVCWGRCACWAAAPSSAGTAGPPRCCSTAAPLAEPGA